MSHDKMAKVTVRVDRQVKVIVVAGYLLSMSVVAYVAVSVVYQRLRPMMAAQRGMLKGERRITTSEDQAAPPAGISSAAVDVFRETLSTYREHTRWSCAFKETLHCADGRRHSSFYGELFIGLPDQIRWDYYLRDRRNRSKDEQAFLTMLQNGKLHLIRFLRSGTLSNVTAPLTWQTRKQQQQLQDRLARLLPRQAVAVMTNRCITRPVMSISTGRIILVDSPEIESLFQIRFARHYRCDRKKYCLELVPRVDELAAQHRIHVQIDRATFLITAILEETYDKAQDGVASELINFYNCQSGWSGREVIVSPDEQRFFSAVRNQYLPPR